MYVCLYVYMFVCVFACEKCLVVVYNAANIVLLHIKLNYSYVVVYSSGLSTF